MSLNAHIFHTSSITTICNTIQTISQDTSSPLVFFDIDDTLGLLSLNITTFPTQLVRHVINPWSPLTGWSRFHTILTLRPVESATISCIHTLQHSHIPLFALTGRFPQEAQETYRQLTEMGVNFSSSILKIAPEIPDDYYISLASSQETARYYKGIICCGNLNKGIVLQQFLTRIKTPISHLFFIDDKAFNIENVEAVLHNDQIPHTIFLYTSPKLYRILYSIYDCLLLLVLLLGVILLARYMMRRLKKTARSKE